MRPSVAIYLIIIMAATLQGCGTLTNGTYTGSSNEFAPSVKVMISAADQRLIVKRASPVMGKADSIICAEPSPDIAKAFQAALQASGTAPSGPQGSLQFSSSEAITALAGRTPTVVALRDGLFRACEAYANGQIGKIGYALILSQYGNLLTTLMLGEAAATASSGGSGGGANAAGTGGSGSRGTTPTVNFAVNAPTGGPAATPAKSATDSKVAPRLLP